MVKNWGLLVTVALHATNPFSKLVLIYSRLTYCVFTLYSPCILKIANYCVLFKFYYTEGDDCTFLCTRLQTGLVTSETSFPHNTTIWVFTSAYSLTFLALRNTTKWLALSFETWCRAVLYKLTDVSEVPATFIIVFFLVSRRMRLQFISKRR